MEWLLITISAFILISVYAREQRIRVLEKRLARTHQLLRLVADKLGLPEDNMEAELRQLVDKGNRVEALKRVREAYGMKLRDAKEYVDSL
jgi:ribosomal protein L7/L12